MGRQAWAIGTLCLLLCVGLSGLASANTDLNYEPGFKEWNIIPHERLFVEGSDVEEAVLQREQTDSAVGGFTVGPTNGPVPVFTLQSPPVEQPVEAQVFMSVYFSAIIEGGGGPQTCTRQTFTDSSTTLIYSVSDGSGEIYSTESTQTLDTSAEGDAMNFSGEMQNVTLTLDVGQSITLSLSVEHRCLGTQARVQWGGFEQNSGGVIIEGVLYEPEARIHVDAARLAHVELEHRLPWGIEDLRDEKWEIWGPLLPTDKTIRDGEYLVETSAGRIRMTRDLGGNNTVYTWSGAKPLPVGELNLQFCLEDDRRGPEQRLPRRRHPALRSVPEDDGFASAAFWLTLDHPHGVAGLRCERLPYRPDAPRSHPRCLGGAGAAHPPDGVRPTEPRRRCHHPRQHQNPRRRFDQIRTARRPPSANCFPATRPGHRPCPPGLGTNFDPGQRI